MPTSHDESTSREPFHGRPPNPMCSRFSGLGYRQVVLSSSIYEISEAASIRWLTELANFDIPHALIPHTYSDGNVKEMLLSVARDCHRCNILARLPLYSSAIQVSGDALE